MTDFKSVDEYIASQPEAVQGILKRVRSTIRKAVPEAEEVISYKIPTYKLPGGPIAGDDADFGPAVCLNAPRTHSPSLLFLLTVYTNIGYAVPVGYLMRSGPAD